MRPARGCGRTLARPGGAFGIAALGAVVLGIARAAAGGPEAPPEICKAQVSRAAALIAQEVIGPRRLPSGAPGTLEYAVRAYVPTRFHAVDEGTPHAASAPATSLATCPADMAPVGAFCVDRYEGSLLVRARDGTLTPADPFVTPRAGYVHVARSVAGVMPQAYISAAESAAACREAGKRLCQPLEWRVACGGSQGTTYPYGATRAPGKCHDSGANPMMLLHADTVRRGWGPLELNDSRANALEGALAKTGTFPDCVNDLGLYDMVGNLHEWTADPNGTFQGGFWLDTSRHGDGCAYRTSAHDFTYHDYSTGFRCCADPRAPASDPR